MGRPDKSPLEEKGSRNVRGGEQGGSRVAIHWFRHGLRLHDNPALLQAIQDMDELYCVFIFDGEVAGTEHSGYNRFRFLIQSLEDLDEQLQEFGGRLYVFYGEVLEIFSKLFEEWGVERLTFEQDPEPIWQARDQAVSRLCKEKDVECVECISLTLYDPAKVIDANGGLPPNTFQLLNTVVEGLGQPPRPVDDPDFSTIKLPVVANFDKHFRLKTLDEMGKKPEIEQQLTPIIRWEGGERRALALLDTRLIQEQKAYESGYVMPNQHTPQLSSQPTSMSPHLRFGCLSVRRFYWAIYDLYVKVVQDEPIQALNSQLMWREYFYIMSINNANFDKMENNPICLQIPWYTNPEHLEKWTKGETGFPWIDACMKQLVLEGWIHHVCRHAVSCFLTRGDLWLHWEEGFKVFRKYQLDADWSVNSGNWMWMSSSAFEDCLQCPKCFSPVFYGMRMDPDGTYIRRYLPVLKNMPLKYLFSPWKAPKEVQEAAGCVIGKDYPEPMVDHKKASKNCQQLMNNVKNQLKDASSSWHITPSNSDEARQMCWLPSMQSQGSAGSVSSLADSFDELNHNHIGN